MVTPTVPFLGQRRSIERSCHMPGRRFATPARRQASARYVPDPECRVVGNALPALFSPLRAWPSNGRLLHLLVGFDQLLRQG